MYQFKDEHLTSLFKQHQKLLTYLYYSIETKYFKHIIGNILNNPC